MAESDPTEQLATVGTAWQRQSTQLGSRKEPVAMGSASRAWALAPTRPHLVFRLRRALLLPTQPTPIATDLSVAPP